MFQHGDVRQQFVLDGLIQGVELRDESLKIDVPAPVQLWLQAHMESSPY